MLSCVGACWATASRRKTRHDLGAASRAATAWDQRLLARDARARARGGPASMTPTARSLAYARRQGWTAGVVERWNPHAKVRHDLFGWIDLVLLADAQIIGVQACAGASHAARRAKVLASPTLPQWRICGGRAEIWSWAKHGARGQRKLWVLRRERL